jgi:hypothetical protein
VDLLGDLTLFPFVAIRFVPTSGRAARNRLLDSLEPSAFGFTRILRSSHRRRILLAGIERECCACVGDSVVCSGFGLSQQSLELGEDLLDRIEVGRVFGQEHDARADGSDGLSHRLSLMGAEIVEDDDVARLEGWREELFDIGAEAFAVNGAVEQAGRIDAVIAQGGKKRRGLPATMRNLVDEALSFRAQPRRRVMLVFVQVSSMNTNRLGSMRP